MKQIKKLLLIIAGSISLGLGVLGVILPLLPTTPFLLLAAACYVRSSERLYYWLITNKYFGSYIQNYRDGKGIPLRAKVIGVSVLWLAMSYTILFIIPLLSIKLLLAGIGAYFTWFILKQKTLQNEH
ncbi:MAG TPA: YbaN family protein [Lentibacillus sp.]|uniref:YbaN family protein n=1 Tax=Lentibacillus sp. TaxID=1925746 RepID=UPI002B4B5139|nr:YbaN family protein [Lentibacillus sp.]HLR60966.1 YbaN family protein [Lentibacillus sp.]